MADLSDTMETQIGDIDDLEDRLIVLESIVDQLKVPNIIRAELEVLLNQYIALEDSIINGLHQLARKAEDLTSQNLIGEATSKFNELGSDYQDSWNEEFWEIYNMIREGYQTSAKKKTGQEINSQIESVQEIALALNRTKNKSQNDDRGKKAIEEVEELSKTYQISILGPQIQDFHNNKCKCVLI
ncbi:unnamed protein product [Blepharisma stoltei]|uniref:Glycogen debranching enzyme C-terminal domain-containing protein n=1 Tax=Blepharisma stoltei TaxID=1481888 RepID=A0AAU9J445_9CILI|nr:unnamed protein product [Blepharisma stoltei]